MLDEICYNPSSFSKIGSLESTGKLAVGSRSLSEETVVQNTHNETGENNVLETKEPMDGLPDAGDVCPVCELDVVLHTKYIGGCHTRKGSYLDNFCT